MPLFRSWVACRCAVLLLSALFLCRLPAAGAGPVVAQAARRCVACRARLVSETALCPACGGPVRVGDCPNSRTYRSGLRYRRAEAAYRAGRYTEACALLLPIATAGDARAQLMYAELLGIRPLGQAESVRWLGMALRQGEPSARVDFAERLAEGAGVPRSRSEARLLMRSAIPRLRAAAGAGDYVAQMRLAVRYLIGDVVPKNEKQAVYWLRQSASQGYAVARDQLGELYATGTGVPLDPAQAIGWFRRAADQGSPIAMMSLGRVAMLLDGDAEQAIVWFRRAAALGDPEGQQALGLSYCLGRGVAKDPVEGVRWYRLAADQGVDRAQRGLGSAYFTGDGVAKDPVQAVYWYRKAAAQGDGKACYNLAVCYETGAGVAASRKDAIYWYGQAFIQGQEGGAAAVKRLKATQNR